ncbi:sugar ABC transporter ATP-binding protein [Sphingomonas sp.]|jgi:simple sugar transport system ATP-binding protein|uniref:sugar ABC transporter ATP-binding protein n=1 Tax=Sphingomonas sp. TaxID=28214 RepID=UPI002ED78968
MSGARTSTEVLNARGISRAFPGVLALDHVDFELRGGEIHALMGENGAGKSTLIKILTGALSPSGGAMTLAGAPYAPGGTAAAQRAGVWAVHQEISVLPNLSVAENLFLGHQPTRLGIVRTREMHAAARAVLAELDLDLDVTRLLGGYPVAVQQLIAIARAACGEARVLVLDEPTASLDAAEVEILFALVRRLAAKGVAIVLITHFLDQAYSVSDRFTVLRNGKLIGTRAAAELPRGELVSMMLGKELAAHIARAPGAGGSERPLVARFRGLGRKGSVEGFDLDLHAGEAVGVAGLLGSGRTETAMLMFGADAAERGSIEVDGREARLRAPRDAIRLGFGFSPEERKTDGIVGALSVRENIVLALQARTGWFRKIPRARQDAIAQHYIALLGIRTPDAEKPIEQLSGGNQQKALLARWLATEPRVLILDEPTRGIDVGAHAEIVRLIERLRDDGMALYVISSELEELAAYADRVTVMRDRKQVGMLEGEQVSVAGMVSAIAGSAT